MENKEKSKYLFREARLRTVGGRRLGRARKHLEIPLSGGKVRRRDFPADSLSFWHSTFGYTMIVAETRAGTYDEKKSGQGRLPVVRKESWLSAGGWINAIIPILIVPYYSVIGGWVIKYLAEYVLGHGRSLAADGYFSAVYFQTAYPRSSALSFFPWCTLVIIYAGVRNGVERVSKLMMPVLVVLSVIIAVYSVTRPGALGGVKYFLRAESGEFFLDDRCGGHGADVLLLIHCHGNSGDLRLLYEEGYFN